jgi:hypothetical protein
MPAILCRRLDMIGSRRTVALTALAVLLAGCGGNTIVENGTGGGGTGGGGTGGGGTGGNPLVGAWHGSATFGTMSLTESTLFNSDGTASATDTFQVVGVGACTGALDISEPSWTSTSSTLSVAGGMCTGQVTCPGGVTIPCGAGETMAQICTYTLSADDDTLVLTCPNAQGPITFTRSG